MKRISTLVLVLASALVIQSCDTKDNKVVTASGRGFVLGDVADQSVKQAADNTVKVSIDREGGFDGEVKIEVSGLPAGVTIEGGNSKTILARDSAVSLKMLATDTAVPTEKNEVRVKASATVDGKPLDKTENFNLTVKAR